MIAEYATSQWLQNLQANPTVEVKVAGRVFPAKARVVDPAAEPDLHRMVSDLSQKKYGWGDGTIVELTENREQGTKN